MCRRALERLAKKMRLPAGTVSVSIVGKNEMQKLNRQWRRVDAPTDVLSFALQEGTKIPEGDGKQYGDIILNKDDIRSRAKKLQVSGNKISTFLFVHGFLHCAGFDHATKRQVKKMRALERFACGSFVYYDHS